MDPAPGLLQRARRRLSASGADLLSRLSRPLAAVAVRRAAADPTPARLGRLRRATGIQLTVSELDCIASAVRSRGACRFLVFGLGNDSVFWHALNAGGRTVFLEDDAGWHRRVVALAGGRLEAYLVAYGTVRTEWETLLSQPARLDMAWPPAVADTGWDVVLVDAPAGWHDAAPGRMKSIFGAARLAAPGADVFVHDCERPAERAYADRFLGAANLRRAVDRLRHYRTGAVGAFPARLPAGPGDTNPPGR